MADLYLFAEVFPIPEAAIPQLAAYRIEIADGFETDAVPVGDQLTYRLERAFSGHWLWLDNRVITDAPRTTVELMITLDALREEAPQRYQPIESIEEDTHWQPTPIALAQFIMHSYLTRDLEKDMQQVLAKPDLRVPNAIIRREPQLQAWTIQDTPAISLSIGYQLLAEKDLKTYAAEVSSSRALIGLRVKDKTSSLTGEIVGTAGKVGKHRDRLLKLTRQEAMQNLILRAPDDESVVRVQVGEQEYEYIASALDIVIRTDENHDDMEQFAVDERQARRILHQQPAVQAQLIRAVSEVAKNAGLLADAFNSRDDSLNVFLEPQFEANLKYADNQVRPYRTETLSTDFATCGVYQRQKKFQSEPIRIAVINTLNERIDDFIEAMQRQLERQFGFSIEPIRERKVKVLSRKNLASAVKVVAKEKAHIVLVFVPDDPPEMSAEATAGYLKSLVVGQGIASQVIRESTVNDPDAMALVIMGVLGKTGNIPFVLAEPMPYAPYIIGLDIVEEKRHVTAIARIYESDGTFVCYAIREITLEDENMLYVLMRDLLPQKVFANQQAIIHHNGSLSASIRDVLAGWGQAIGATFYPVEIMTENVPHLYALQNGKITAPPWGSAFRLSDTEAFIVTTAPADGSLPTPLYVRTTLPLTIELALHSLLVWTLLYYGTQTQPRLPVTIQYSDVIGQWLTKGTMPEKDGTVPFWL